jgi:hypothetical protein
LHSISKKVLYKYGFKLLYGPNRNV